MPAASVLRSQRLLQDADEAIEAAHREAEIFRELRRVEGIVRRFGDRRRQDRGRKPDRRRKPWISSNDSSSRS